MPEFIENTDREFKTSTMREAFEVLIKKYSEHALIQSLCMKWGVNGADLGGGVYPKMMSLMEFVRDNYSKRINTDIGNSTLEYAAVHEAASSVEDWWESENYEKFQRCLALDGFSIIFNEDGNGELKRSLPIVAGSPAPDDEVIQLLIKYQFSTTEGHLEQALSNFTLGNWAASNAQIRTFIESLFDEICGRLSSTGHKGANARTELMSQQISFISQGLNEWSNDGKSYLNGILKRLHPEGNHPGLSDMDDTLFRIQIVLVTASMYLRRFDKRSS